MYVFLCNVYIIYIRFKYIILSNMLSVYLFVYVLCVGIQYTYIQNETLNKRFAFQPQIFLFSQAYNLHIWFSICNIKCTWFSVFYIHLYHIPAQHYRTTVSLFCCLYTLYNIQHIIYTIFACVHVYNTYNLYIYIWCV